MRLRIDFSYVLIAAVVSFFITLLIIRMIKHFEPQAVPISPGSAIFIYIGVLFANLIIELFRR